MIMPKRIFPPVAPGGILREEFVVGATHRVAQNETFV
jgi:hypothetical protein